MEQAEGYTITKADAERIKAKDAKMTPEERRALSKDLVEANTAANEIRELSDSSSMEKCSIKNPKEGR